MPNMLFSSNNVSHFPGAATSSNTATFDDTRVPYSIALTNEQYVSSPKFKPTTNDTTWFHFRVYGDSIERTTGPELMKVFDTDGKTLFRLDKMDDSSYYYISSYLYDGDATQTSNTTIPCTRSMVNSIDVAYVTSPISITLKVHINGTLASTTEFGANANAYGGPTNFSIAPGFRENFSDTTYFSEFIVADGDTRNARLNLLRPSAVGAYDEWGGLLGALADDDTTTGMTTIEANKRQTMLMTPYTGATNISNIVTVSSTTRGQNSPSKLKHTVRLGGVDYDGPEHDVDFALAYQLTDFTINPATSLPWDSADLSVIETGFVSVA